MLSQRNYSYLLIKNFFFDCAYIAKMGIIKANNKCRISGRNSVSLKCKGVLRGVRIKVSIAWNWSCFKLTMLFTCICNLILRILTRHINDFQHCLTTQHNAKVRPKTSVSFNWITKGDIITQLHFSVSYFVLKFSCFNYYNKDRKMWGFITSRWFV